MTYRPYQFIKASGVELSADNNTGGTLDKGTPIRVDSLGELRTIDVSNEAHALAVVGVLRADALDGSQGIFVNSGRVENITITGSFGDSVYVSKTGGLTTTKPSIGVGGFVALDFVIRVGVIAKNVDNPVNKDLVLDLNVVGQL
jgi:hypothetical protein